MWLASVVIAVHLPTCLKCQSVLLIIACIYSVWWCLYKDYPHRCWWFLIALDDRNCKKDWPNQTDFKWVGQNYWTAIRWQQLMLIFIWSWTFTLSGKLLLKFFQSIHVIKSRFFSRIKNKRFLFNKNCIFYLKCNFWSMLIDWKPDPSPL